MYYISFNEKGDIVNYGENSKAINSITFEVNEEDFKYISKAKAIIENDIVVGYQIDKNLVIDEETNEVVPKGETLTDKLETLQNENNEKDVLIQTLQADVADILKLMAQL